MVEDAAKGAAAAILDGTPGNYLPIILIAAMFILILAGFCILTNKHNEKLFKNSLTAIKEAYTESMKAQNETIRILTKDIATARKKN